MKFEEAFERLKQISAEMEKNDIPLEESVKLYSEAARLVEECQKELSDAKLNIEKLENGGQV